MSIRRWTLTWLLLLLGLAAVATAATAQDAEELVIGLSVHGREVAAVSALRAGGEFQVPLDDLAGALGCRVEAQEGSVRLVTPLGTVPVAGDGVSWQGERLYVSEGFIARGLHAPVSFDPRDFELVIDLPWTLTAPAVEAGRAPQVPDARPPAFSCSTFRQELTAVEGSDSGRTANGLVEGCLGGGTWHGEYHSDFEGHLRLREYAWQRVAGPWLLLAGQEWVQLHPLLPSLELTGIQAGWTNLPLENTEAGADAGGLLTRRSRPGQTIRGEAEPGTIARLLVDGVPVAQVLVGLDGGFEFRNVPLPSHQLNQVEIHLFDRHHLGIPSEIIEYRLNGSEYILPEGGVTHLAGAGYGGNVADRWLLADMPGQRGAAAFYQVRRAIGGDLTLEAALQEFQGTTSAQAGLITRLGRSCVLGFGAATANGETGWSAELDGPLAGGWVTAMSLFIPEGFSDTGRPGGYENHLFQAEWRLGRALLVGLEGRRHLRGGERQEYLLPRLDWHPRPELTLRLRPTFDGDYRLDGFWRVTADTRLSAMVEDFAIVELAHRLGRLWGLTLGSQVADGGRERLSAVVSRDSARWGGASLHAGLLTDDGDLGVIAGGSLRVLPGVYARVEYQSAPPVTMEPEYKNALFFASLTTDFTFAGGRAFPAAHTAARRRGGAVAGRVTVAGVDIEGNPCAGLAVTVDGRRSVDTDRSGAFFLGDLEPGLHTVSLDVARLPLELVPVRSTVVAEVSAGATTRVDFVVRPEYGVAGRVRGPEGSCGAGIRVTATDGAGHLAADGATDRFGLYRLDGLPPGGYTLAVRADTLPQGLAPGPPLAAELSDQFLFGQDLRVERAADGGENSRNDESSPPPPEN